MKSDRHYDLTQGPILAGLLSFTVPILMGDLFQQLYNVADTVIVGRLLGSASLAAVGAAGTLLHLIVGFASSMANGFSVIISQRFGAKDDEGVRKSYASGILLTFAIGLVLTAVIYAALPALLRVMNTPDDIFDETLGYIRILAGGMLLTLFYNFFAASLRSIGNSRAPLYFLVFSSTLNIVLDLILITLTPLGVRAAALATLLAQGISALACLFYIRRYAAKLHVSSADFIPDRALMKRQVTIGLPMGFQSVVITSGLVFMQAVTNSFGSTAIAGYAAASKLRSLSTQPMLSFGNAMAIYAGQNYGARDVKRVKDGVRTATFAGMIYAVAIAIVLNLALPGLMRLFFDAESLAPAYPYAQTYILIASSCYIPYILIATQRHALQGCGKSMTALSASFVELAARIIFAALATRYHSFVLCVLCDPGAWLIDGIYMTIVWYLYSKNLTIPEPVRDGR